MSRDDVYVMTMSEVRGWFGPAKEYSAEDILKQYGVPAGWRQRILNEDATGPYRQEILKLTKVIEQLKSQPARIGLVLKVKDGRATLLIAGQQVNVPNPVTDLVAGDTVNVTGDTMQILTKGDPADQRPGEVCTLKAVNKGSGEIERGGATRMIILPLVANPGDRVVVDDSGSIATSVLGPEKTASFTESTGVTWDDVGGLETAKAQLRDAIEGPVRDKARFDKFGRRPARGALLYGAPGCGKTMLGKAAATAVAEMHGAKSAFYYIKGPELLNMYVGNTEAAIRKMFANARRQPSVIFLDEADAILGARGQHSFGLEKTIVPAFLAEMDGLTTSGTIVLLATNRPDSLDPAIVRDGRIDRRIHVTRPTKADVQVIATKALTARPGDTAALATALTRELFNKSLVIKKPLTLAHMVSGALVVGIVERASAAAMARDAEFIEEEDIFQGVTEAHRENLHINHDDEMVEHFG